MGKHQHIIILNSQPRKQKYNFKYNFSHTKDVEISVGKNSIAISVWLTKYYDKNEMLSSGVYLFPDAIKKALLLHILSFSENIHINRIIIKIDDNKDVIEFPVDHLPPIYSIIIDKLKRDMPSEFIEQKTVEGILSKTKTTYDSRIASLYALICSKSKHYEAERFIYLWMAFNGMYGYFSSVIADIQNKNGRIPEYKQILYFQELIGVGRETINDKDKARIAHEVIALIKKYNPLDISKKLLDTTYKSLSEEISSSLINSQTHAAYNLSVYGYLLTQFSYYFRCNIIHANKPLALFSYADEMELKCLKVINDLLEEYIDENLPLWFQQDYMGDHILPIASTIKI